MYVRQNAAKALGKLGEVASSALPALRKLLKSENEKTGRKYYVVILDIEEAIANIEKGIANFGEGIKKVRGEVKRGIIFNQFIRRGG